MGIDSPFNRDEVGVMMRSLTNKVLRPEIKIYQTPINRGQDALYAEPVIAFWKITQTISDGTAAAEVLMSN